MKALAWNPESLPDDEEDDDDNELRRTIKGKGREIIEDSNELNYPMMENDEGEDIDFSRIGTGEWGEKRKEKEKSLVYSGALGNRRSDSLRSRRRFNQSSISSGSRREAAQSRREMALERLGLESPHGTSRFRYGSSNVDVEYEDEEEEEDEKEMSEYDYVDGERVQQGSYWPMTFRAKYAPRMLGLRIADKAISTVVLLVNYIRFFLILSFAIFFALYQ